VGCLPASGAEVTSQRDDDEWALFSKRQQRPTT
jgi:hypothetical protein